MKSLVIAMLVLVSGTAAAQDAEVLANNARITEARDREYDAALLAKVRSMPTLAVCEEYSSGASNDIALNELKRRHAFPATELSAIAAKSVRVGLSAHAVLCMAGAPVRAYTTVDASGRHLMLVYPNMNVFIANNRVASFSYSEER